MTTKATHTDGPLPTDIVDPPEKHFQPGDRKDTMHWNVGRTDDGHVILLLDGHGQIQPERIKMTPEQARLMGFELAKAGTVLKVRSHSHTQNINEPKESMMAPSIDEIIDGLIAGTVSKEDAQKWTRAHMEFEYSNGVELASQETF